MRLIIGEHTAKHELAPSSLMGAVRTSCSIGHMTRTNIAGSSPYEPIIGFSRAVRIGNIVHVAGTGPVGAEDLSAYEQTRTVLDLVGKALTQAGAGFEHVVRTRMYITRAEDWEEIGRAHGEIFSNIRPAATMVVVKELLNPKWRIEIEAEGVIS
jgi:enamine deaminase RidA (YjgF/YER057c/UK114 family)